MTVKVHYMTRHTLTFSKIIKICDNALMPDLVTACNRIWVILPKIQFAPQVILPRIPVHPGSFHPLCFSMTPVLNYDAKGL